MVDGQLKLEWYSYYRLDSARRIFGPYSIRESSHWHNLDDCGGGPSVTLLGYQPSCRDSTRTGVRGLLCPGQTEVSEVKNDSMTTEGIK